jgi:outer membrane protein assembly factor BamA
LFTGVAIPYGNTPEFVPFERRFFTGGVNSLRAWRPRSIGPGSFAQKDQLDFSGEIKLEANAEFRFNLYNKWLEGAVFTDAGNVWAVKDDLKSPGANFRFKDFYKSVAWDAGVGLRLNLSIFIIRFDFAVPLHDPTFVESERWVIKKIDSNWLLNNTNFNFGIGYPF